MNDQLIFKTIQEVLDRQCHRKERHQQRQEKLAQRCQVSLSPSEWLVLCEGGEAFCLQMLDKLDAKPATPFVFVGNRDEANKGTVQAMHVWNALLPQRELKSRALSMVPRDQDRITIKFIPQERNALTQMWFAFFPYVTEFMYGSDTKPEFPHERLPLKEHWGAFMDAPVQAIGKVQEHLPEDVLPRAHRLGFTLLQQEIAAANA